MKKLILIIGAAILLSALANLPIKATAGGYYTYSKILCARYLKLSHQALSGKDYTRAKLFAMKAIQSDTFNKTAWLNYDRIVVKMSGGKAALHTRNIMVQSKPEAKTNRRHRPAPSKGGAFVGC